MTQFLSAFFLTGAASLAAPADTGNHKAAWERSVVVLDVTRKEYDYFQPWTRRVKNVHKAGLVLPGREILTTADQMYDRTLVRIQKNGRGKWWTADVSWIDYHANLAAVTPSEPEFWEGLEPAILVDKPASYENLQIVRWREGKMETRKAEFNQFTVDMARLSYVSVLELELGSDIQGVGWGEPVVADGQVIGLLSEQTGNKYSAIPASFIRPVLEARRAGAYRGLGFFDFYWEAAENPASQAFLTLPNEHRGVIVIQVPSKPGVEPVLKLRDVLLQIDGFDIDTHGDYEDPDFGRLLLENLSTRRRWAGDEVKLKVWREGKEIDVTYRLPKADYSSTLVPDATYDQEPEYLIVGGLVFQPLNDPFLKGWGPEWKRRSPFRLYYYNEQEPTPERPSLVLLTQVLPDIYNLGYQELRYLVLDQVNGQKIAKLQDLKAALQKPINGFHEILFARSDSLRRMVLSADDMPAATRRVLQRYGITRDFYFVSAGTAQDGTATAGR
ncbi:MAG: hypothetical protein HY735_20655 [Verrucomicrobia bacterium]|nr:hypothetical protein [Verrucomicrobiota bacterium]